VNCNVHEMALTMDQDMETIQGEQEPTKKKKTETTHKALSTFTLIVVNKSI